MKLSSQIKLDVLKEQFERDEKLKMPLSFFPDPVLSKQCEKIEVIDDGIKELVKRMFATMRLLDWGFPAGLAAPQVGQSVQLFIAMNEVFINPKLVWVTKAPKEYLLEGCYSGERDKFTKVWRAPSVRLTWQDLDGNYHDRRFNGFPAQVIQHEYEHLNLDGTKSEHNHVINKV